MTTLIFYSTKIVTTMRRTAILLAVLALSLGLTGVAAAQDDVEPNVEANPQVTLGDNVTVEEADIDGDGYLVVHEDPDGENYTEDTVLGVAEIEEGENEDVVVELDEQLEERQLLHAVLYFGGDEFEFDDASPVEEETDEGFESAEADFYVVVGDPDHERLGDTYQSLAENLQQRQDFRQQLSDLEDRLDQLEESDNESVESEKEDLRDEIDTLETNIDDLDGQIENTTTLIDDILEAEQDLDNQSDDGGDNDGGDGAEGLPGFTAFAAVVSLMAFAFLARREN